MPTIRTGYLLPVLFAVFLTGAARQGKGVRTMKRLTVTSSAFSDGNAMPSRYSCDGDDINPPLSFAGVPAEAESLALVVDDPDAPVGTWVHWVLWNIPPHTREIGENSVPAGVRQGLNDWKRNDYGGPCPPSGSHRYVFKLYALDSRLDLPAATTKKALEKAMEGHILATGELIGRYRRR